MPAASIAEVNRILTAPGEPLEIETCHVRGVATRWWKNIPPTLTALLQHSRVHSALDYLVYEDERLSYAQTYIRIATLAAYLRDECGVKKGDRVALAMRNFPEWVIGFWSVVSAGAIVVPLNAWWKGNELQYALSDSESRVLLCDEERATLIAPHLPGLPIERVLVARASSPLAAGWESFETAMARTSVDVLPEIEIEPDDFATIFYTSGTTGHPKGALGTHRNMCANIGSSLFVRMRAALRGGRSFVNPNGQHSALISVPLFHVTGSHSGLVTGTFIGAKLVMMRRWNAERALELIERERISQFGGVPSMVWQVLESPEFSRRDTSTLGAVSYGGAPAAPELVRRIRDAFPQCTASNGYGLTETSALVIANVGIDYERKPDSIGLPVAVCEVKVIAADGGELAIGGVGELCIKGPNVVAGYWRKPEASARSFQDGWLHTGDIARLDDEGFVYILDRAKDMLIRGGENVYCVEVEDVLYSHPAVMDAAVIGIPHRVLGEEVGAVVQLVPGSSLDPEALRAFTAERLAGFKVPAKIVIQHEPLPRNANGKILKRDLKQQLGWT